MYTNYTNNYDTSHVAYPEHLTTEQQSADGAIFVALQPPNTHLSNTTITRRSSSTTALHTYPIHYIPSYIFPATTSPSPST